MTPQLCPFTRREFFCSLAVLAVVAAVPLAIGLRKGSDRFMDLTDGLADQTTWIMATWDGHEYRRQHIKWSVTQL